ncbi:MAG: 2'-5' RNA ligase family protein [Scrofimicrobium sp.]
MFLPKCGEHEELLGIVIAVPEPWNAAITEIRQSIGDPMATKVPPHITIMPPLAVPEDKRGDVFEHLRGLAEEHRPFRIGLKGADTFEPVSPVAFLKVVQGAGLCKQLAEDVRSGPLDYSLRFPYHAHVTLAQNLPSQAITRALELGHSFEASWMVQGFRIDRVEKDGSYVSTAIFDFSTGLA